MIHNHLFCCLIPHYRSIGNCLSKRPRSSFDLYVQWTWKWAIQNRSPVQLARSSICLFRSKIRRPPSREREKELLTPIIIHFRKSTITFFTFFSKKKLQNAKTVQPLWRNAHYPVIRQKRYEASGFVFFRFFMQTCSHLSFLCLFQESRIILFFRSAATTTQPWSGWFWLIRWLDWVWSSQGHHGIIIPTTQKSNYHL